MRLKSDILLPNPQHRLSSSAENCSITSENALHSRLAILLLVFGGFALQSKVALIRLSLICDNPHSGSIWYSPSSYKVHLLSEKGPGTTNCTPRGWLARLAPAARHLRSGGRKDFKGPCLNAYAPETPPDP